MIKSKRMHTINTFLIAIIFSIQIFLPLINSENLLHNNDIISDLNSENEEKNYINNHIRNNIPNLQNLQNWDYDNISHRYIFIYEDQSQDFIQIMNNFTNLGGVIKRGPWKNINGFSGIINNSQNILGNFTEIYSNISIYDDSYVQAQMNSIHDQLQIYPKILNQESFGYLGDENSSIAILDSGIDQSHSLINQSNLNFWCDYTNDTNEDVIDENGHGTAIAAIIAGGGNKTLESTKDGLNYLLSITKHYNHAELFYPHHITPGWYKIKLITFSLDEETSDNLFLDVNISDYSSFSDFQIELYKDGDLIESNSNENLSISRNLTGNTGTDKVGIYDIVFTYEIEFTENPIFDLSLNLSFSPLHTLQSLANYTGIAPNAQLSNLRILNKSGVGYASDMISALEFVWENNSKYHIFASVLSIGNFDMNSKLADRISFLIDKVIDNGTMVIIAAGNKGISSESLNKLAINKKAIVVGAINGQDQLTYYSSRGEISDDSDEIYKPDIVAPGGSLLDEHESIITADTNQGDFQNSMSDITQNDLTTITGTSVSAAVIAGIYSLLMDHFGGWNNWNTTNGESALYFKQLLLSTASETNMQREDNPSTPFDESSSSPTLERGGTDIHEGFGRINPSAIFQLLNSSFTINATESINLQSSISNSSGNHIYASKINLEKNKLYLFNLTNDEDLFSNYDVDMYLYEPKIDKYGLPSISSSNVQTGTTAESFYFTNFNKTKDFYIILKAINGEGTVSLEITKEILTKIPILANATLDIINPGSDSKQYNDTLDTYHFEINYSQSGNFPAIDLFLNFDDSTKNISMVSSVSDTNFTDGCIYSIDHKFDDPGNYSFSFFVRIGHFKVTYTDLKINNITVNPIGNLTSFGYKTYFSQGDNLWTMDSSIMNYSLNNENITVKTGWNWVNVSNELENRKKFIDEQYWYSMYCGISSFSGTKNKLLEYDNKPIYSYQYLSKTYNLISPYILINDSLNNPFVKMGLRADLIEGDSLNIQINSNRSSSWINLDSFTNLKRDWFYLDFNLSDFKNDYIRIRIQVNLDGNDINYGSGIMLDFITFEEKNITNDFEPSISKYHQISVGYEEQPYITSFSNTKFESYTFQLAYTDIDGNLPEYVHLEIGNENESTILNMDNKFGRWNPEMNISSSDDYSKEIIFTYTISLFGFSDTSFRFRTSDGKYFISTNWKNTTDFIDMTPLEIPFLQNFKMDEMSVLEYPLSGSSSLWIPMNSLWHQVIKSGKPIYPGEFYCGIGNYQGYKYNYNCSLITPLISLNETKDIFFNFSHRLRFDVNGEEGGDYAEVSISSNLGKNWDLLETFTEQTEGLGKKQIKIDISKYLGKNVQFKFQFYSDDTGIQLANSGWKISDISIDIDRTMDYIPPTILFLNLNPGEKITGIYNITISLLDNKAIDLERTQFWIGTENIEFLENNGIYCYSIDTDDYKNGQLIEIIVIAYDLEGNRQVQRITVEIQNPLTNFQIGLITFASVFIFALIAFSYIRMRKIKKLQISGDYVKKLSILERIEKKRYEDKHIWNDMEMIGTQIDQNWERNQPFKLYCKNCKKKFISPEFEIFCPSCKMDSLHITKYCPVCKKWRYFDHENKKHICKKCDLILLKDFNNAKEKIIDMKKEGRIVKKASIEDKEDFIEIAQRIPNEELKELIEDLIEVENFENYKGLDKK